MASKLEVLFGSVWPCPTPWPMMILWGIIGNFLLDHWYFHQFVTQTGKNTSDPGEI